MRVWKDARFINLCFKHKLCCQIVELESDSDYGTSGKHQNGIIFEEERRG